MAEQQPNACPSCGAAVEPGWKYCPHCIHALRAEQPPEAMRPPPELDVEVKRDAGGTAIGLGIFLAIVGVGLLLLLAGGAWQLARASPQGLVVLMIGLALVALIVVGTVALMAASRSTASRVLSGVMGGLSIVLAVALGAVLLIVFAVFAFIASVMETCAKCGAPP